MLLLVLLLPACWAVEVRRPRGVSLTSESAAAWGVGLEGPLWLLGGRLQPLASVPRLWVGKVAALSNGWEQRYP